MVFKKYIQRPLLLFCILFLVTTVVFFPVSAEDYNNDYFDFDEYATYSYDVDNSLISAKINLPEEWLFTYSYDGAGYGAWYNGYNFDTIVSKTPISWQFNRFARINNTGSKVGSQIRNAHFIDLNYLPSGTKLHEEFIVTTLTDYQISSSGVFMACYVDSTGKVISREDISVNIDITDLVDGGKKYTLSTIYNFTNVPSDAAGFYYIVRLNTGLTYFGDDITTIVNNTTFTFSYSEFEFNLKQEQILRDKVSNIENQLGDLITGTPEQNQQVQDAIGGLNNSTDKLGQLGDQMASVEKPSIDSSQISAGSLVPSTSLLVLSSPFQALWENNQLLAMLTIVVTLVLVSWVFFGKKG